MKQEFQRFRLASKHDEKRRVNKFHLSGHFVEQILFTRSVFCIANQLTESFRSSILLNCARLSISISLQ